MVDWDADAELEAAKADWEETVIDFRNSMTNGTSHKTLW